jgi:hypothetical protein
MEKLAATTLESLVSKSREVRTVLLSTGEGSEFEAKRLIAATELTEKLLVFRELVIQGKTAVPPRVAEFFKVKNYQGFSDSLEKFRDADSLESEDKIQLRKQIVGFIEDFLLSV